MGTAVILQVLGRKMTACICNYFNSYFCDAGLHLPFGLYLVCKSCVYEDISTVKHSDTLCVLHLKRYLKQTGCLAKEGDTRVLSHACLHFCKKPQGMKAGGEVRQGCVLWMLLEQSVSNEIQLCKFDRHKEDAKG